MAEKPTYEELAQIVKNLEQEKLESNMMKEAIIHGEEWPTNKVESKTNPEILIPEVDLDAIINAREIQSLMDDFYDLTNMASAILDLKGRVIQATGWQDICTKFHRINPQSARNCTESDLFLAKNLKPGESVDYKCKNGLWDVVTPLYVGTKHMGNIYTGQFFYDDEQIDEEFFIKQAEIYGFDKNSYLEAFQHIPRYSRETIKHLISFLVKLATYISKISMANIQLEEEICERKKTENTLSEKEEKYRSLISNILGMVYRAESDWRTEIISNSEAVCGYSPDDINSGKVNWLELIHPDDKLNVFNEGSKLREKPSEIIQQYRIIAKDGNIHWVRDSKKSYFKEGVFKGIDGVVMDISEQKQAEEEKRKLEQQFLQSQKMESVGRLAGGVAHDYNNALSVIIGFTELAIDEAGPNVALHADLEEVLSAATRATDITRQLLAFARKQVVAPKVLDLNGNVESMLKMLHRLIGEDIDLAWLPKSSLWPVKMDPSQIDQILANLCVNARDAIEDVGKITIETENTTFDEDYLDIRHKS
jgi:PAS domain S-box-containing protein